MRSRTGILAGLLAAAPLFGSAVAAQAPGSVYRTAELGPRTVALVTVDEVSPSSYANLIVLAGDTASLVVDAGHGPAVGRAVADLVRDRRLPPVRWIVQTHFHGDHTLGTSALRASFPGAVVLSHPSTRDTLADAGAAMARAERDRIGGSIPRLEEALEAGVPDDQLELYRRALRERRALVADLDTVTAVPADSVVEGQRTIDLGGRVLRILHPGPAHTRGDLVVFDPGSGFLAAGDLLEEAPLWLDGADVAGWARALDLLAELNPVRVLPSHGRVREDAALLAAHRALMNRGSGVAAELRPLAVGALAAEGGNPAIRNRVLAAFADLDEVLAPYGVSDEAFDAYVVELVERLAGQGGQ